MRTRAVVLGLLLPVSAACLPGTGVAAEVAHKAKRAAPSHTSRTSPDVTGTIAKPQVPRPLAGPEADAIPQPFTLPVASRARVRSCGATWRDMKLAGTTGDDDWRDFALKCLVGKGPSPSP